MTGAANSLAARDIAHVVHPFTNLRAHQNRGPLIITRGEGVWVFDDAGNRYLEGLAGLWCTGLGFSERRLVEAARRQLEQLPFTHAFAHRSSEPLIELASRLAAIAPRPLSKVFFVNSGSEAVDSAIKLVWYYNNARGKQGKKRIIGRRRAYHGVSLAGGHLTGLAYAHQNFDRPMADRFLHVTPPCFYREGRAGETEEQFSSRLAEELDTVISAVGSDTVAAFFAEPVMGAGGVLVPPTKYFDKIQAVLRKHDVLLIVDEVICGFGRTGRMWGSDTYGLQPDMIVCAKQLSSAYLPIAAVLMTDRFFDVIAEESDKVGVLGIGFTYGGHPVSAAVALETLRIYESDRIVERAAQASGHFQRRLSALGQHPMVGEARGVGLIGGIEIVRNKATKEQFSQSAKAAALVVSKCLELGLILRALPGDVVGICPPLIITREEVDFLFDRLTAALDASKTVLDG